ncbi:pyridoxal phosphate-dependent aminotransferase [Aspergillus affinis]|uniref:pyridoxal phosphate-dependent aminotransferase n=1 Tax=Aspergillus affinis TaxID=1070780 RepID=UPI0022FE2DFE|nr:pyridoxal phosphate-dependent transferase [Aspergillus affinis]KAI9038543.1 pyridoxal phosphate-dependent transferase [Aspergillus affinis]
MNGHNTDIMTSSRGQRVALAESKSPMSAIFANLYDKDSNPGGLYNVGVAENVLMHDILLEYITKKQPDLPTRYLTYNQGGGGSMRLKAAIGRFLTRHFHPVKPIQPDHVVVTNGLAAALEHLSWALADPGDGILLGRPYYGAFIPDLSLRTATEVVEVAFDGCDPLGSSAAQRYEQALLYFQHRTGKQIRMLVLCHPHNPLGRCYPRETIIQLMRLCQKYGVHLVSDEIYGLSTWENHIDDDGSSPPPVEFESVLSIDTTDLIDDRLVHCLWGLSKDFGANGLRIGAIISQTNRTLHAILSGTSPYSYVSGLSDHVAASLLEDDAFTTMYMNQNCQRIATSFHFAARYLQDRGIEYATGCNAGFFLWMNLGKKYLEVHPDRRAELTGDALTKEIMRLLVSKKVFLASGLAFGSEEPGWFRIVVSHPVDFLQEALRRVEAAICE